MENIAPTTTKLDFENWTPLEIIRECGRLQLSIDQTMLVMRDNSVESRHARSLQADPDSDECRIYMEGFAMGEAQLQSSLMENAIEGKKDGFKNLQQERRRSAINNSIQKNFGIGSMED